MLPIRPTHDGVFVDIIDRDVTKKDLGGGKFFHLLSDDAFTGPHDTVAHKHPGIRPRWARVLAVGPEVNSIREVAVGDLVLCDTLKWSRKIELGRIGLEPVYFWHIRVTDILMTNEAEPTAAYLADFAAKLSQMVLSIGRI